MQYQYETFGEKIKNLREELGLTKTKFAKLFGVTVMCVAKWETGESDPASRALRVIRGKLQANIHYFLVAENKTMYKKASHFQHDVKYCREHLK
jgi:transcriptional regulator with XRE-family HTH domain